MRACCFLSQARIINVTQTKIAKDIDLETMIVLIDIIMNPKCDQIRFSSLNLNSNLE